MEIAVHINFWAGRPLRRLKSYKYANGSKMARRGAKPFQEAPLPLVFRCFDPRFDKSLEAFLDGRRRMRQPKARVAGGWQNMRCCAGFGGDLPIFWTRAIDPGPVDGEGRQGASERKIE
jgi:hypothetical protein